jgi:hypothetical protein
LNSDSGHSSSTGLKRLQREPLVKHNRLYHRFIRKRVYRLAKSSSDWGEGSGNKADPT